MHQSLLVIVLLSGHQCQQQDLAQILRENVPNLPFDLPDTSSTVNPRDQFLNAILDSPVSTEGPDPLNNFANFDRQPQAPTSSPPNFPPEGRFPPVNQFQPEDSFQPNVFEGNYERERVLNRVDVDEFGNPLSPIYNTNNAVYGSNPGQGQGAVYGHHGQYGPAGYLLGYERGQAGRLAREMETMSASSGSVNTRRRNTRGALEQVNEGESTDSRGEEDTRSLTRRQERHRTNSRLGRLKVPLLTCDYGLSFQTAAQLGLGKWRSEEAVLCPRDTSKSPPGQGHV